MEALTDIGIIAMAKAVHHLECLEIANATKVSDAGMRTLALHCSTLRTLNVSGCTGIAGAGLGAISDHCTHMRRLSIANCSHLDEWVLVRLFYNFQHLEHLDVAGCTQVADTTLKTLGFQCRQLTYLNISFCPKVSDTGVVSVAQYCTRLETLLIATLKGRVNERVTDITCLSLGEHCPKLRVFNISGCTFVSDVGIAWLVQGCSQLESLDLTHCFKLTDEGLRSVGANTPSLHTLRIGHAKNLSDVGLRFVSEGCPHLKVLSLHQLYLISDGVKRNFGLEGLQAVAATCPQLSELDLAGCFQVVERALKSLGAGCRALVKVSLKGCYNTTPAGISHLLHGCPKLETLDLSNVTLTSNLVLQDIATSSSHLKELTLAYCDRITDIGVRHLARLSDKLVLLNLSGCSHVTDVGLLAFIQSFRSPTPALSHLILNGCSLVTDEFVNQLAFACPTLLTLSLHGCGMSSRALFALKTSWPYTVFRSTPSELGVFPAHRAKERREIDVAGQLILAAIKIQNTFRQRQSRIAFAAAQEAHKQHVALLEKLLQSGDHRMATKIQRCFRACRNKKHAQDEYDALLEKRRTEAAIFVQRQFRATRRSRIAKIALAAHIRSSKKQHRAAVVMQRRWRGITGRRRYMLAHAAKKAQDAAQEESATQLQALLRGRRARQEAARRRQYDLMRSAEEQAAAITLQSMYRQRLARRQLATRREHLALLHYSAMKMQSVWRARQGRNFLGVLRMAQRRRDEDVAATYIQRHWRDRKTFLQRVWELELRRQLHVRQVAAAKHLCLWWTHVLERRVARVQLNALLALKQRDEAMLFWAAQVVQCHYRRHQARKTLEALKEARRTAWKHMIDIDNSLEKGIGAPYYYNQLNYDVRWRMPGELLTELPQPKCDQCENPSSAEVECAHCGEYFCLPCSDRIHGHGKRHTHTIRLLYNYYRRRIDYGDGDFPSWWPSEFEQDAWRPWDFITGVPLDGYDALVQWIEAENHRLFLLRNPLLASTEATPELPPVVEAPMGVEPTPATVRAINEDSRGNRIVFAPIGSETATLVDTAPVVVPADFDASYGAKSKRRKRRKPVVARQKQILHMG
ncbi:hypothetical protein SPRG_03928 [Saprolegnia parasitica CBS 223.65]|uniref:F-box/LRR-repeat protein 15-like leucin rich repeat domain-containing protein n=1 Tax=Saprolegnia parasitica (strain CBS 223.65) TaxID=695850 RepID=A0A067CWY5_SAPPC|nr:hypothetical protein SPRG_03928 [Saprolegnia parasitica CBS 223.65]KDO31312.1 hypothetical protein SPRG_03928 [Saprolegnia parasitica CBS 223.65]|eukprot:XP_012197911.1 hypothetical protein SPRG_03928 [Saprolegnia parasitica CBS 223.65]